MKKKRLFILGLTTLALCSCQAKDEVVYIYRYESFNNLVNDLDQFPKKGFILSYLFNPEGDYYSFSGCEFRYTVSGLTSDYEAIETSGGHPALSSVNRVTFQIKSDDYLAEIAWYCTRPFEEGMGLYHGFPDEDANGNARHQVFDRLVRGEGDWYSTSEEWKFGFERRDYEQFASTCFYALVRNPKASMSGYVVYTLNTPVQVINMINERVMEPFAIAI